MNQAGLIDLFRFFLKDYESVNILLKHTKKDQDADLLKYLEFGLFSANMTPPVTVLYTQKIEDFPFPPLLILFATQWCLTSDSIMQARNDLAYNNAGVNVKIEDAQRWMYQIQQINILLNQAIEGYRTMKIQYNVLSGFAGVESPYALLHGRFGSLTPTALLATSGTALVTQG